MSATDREQPELLAKIVLTGIPSSGKALALRHLARRFAHDSVRVGEVAGGAIYRTEFYCPEPLADGRRFRVRLFALSGRPRFNAVSELLLADCDGLVFMADVREVRLKEVQAAFRAVVFNVGRGGRDLKSLPAVVQYHHREEHPDFDPDLVDQWLGISPGSMLRLTARHPGEEAALCAGVEQVVKRIAREACPAQEMNVA